MITVFADTSYYIALLHARDDNHHKAKAYTDHFDGRMITTAWIVAELANALAKGANRRSFADLLHDLEGDERVQIRPASDDLFKRGLSLYLRRTDKDWSLTDCISFVVMEEMRLNDALTADRHFEQAGFTVLLG